jgi:hypothetical protein
MPIRRVESLLIQLFQSTSIAAASGCLVLFAHVRGSNERSSASSVLPQDNRYNVEVICHVQLERSSRIPGVDM